MDVGSLSLWIGIKLAIFLAVLILSVLLMIIDNKPYIMGLSILAFTFIVIAIIEFVFVTPVFQSLPITGDKNLKLITNLLYIVGGLGMIWYLSGINSNIKDYK